MKDLIKGFYKENKASKRWKDKLARLLNSKEKNELKAAACLEMGYKFEFWIITREGSIEIDKR